MKEKILIGGLAVAIVAVWIFYGFVVRSNRVALSAGSPNAVSLAVRNVKAKDRVAFLNSVVKRVQAQNSPLVKQARANFGADCAALTQQAQGILFEMSAYSAYADAFFGNSAAGTAWLADKAGELGEQYINTVLEMALGGCVN
jgi:hypothetical protein